jgi:ABC-type iron transport system FetAB permease component
MEVNESSTITALRFAVLMANAFIGLFILGYVFSMNNKLYTLITFFVVCSIDIIAAWPYLNYAMTKYLWRSRL